MAIPCAMIMMVNSREANYDLVIRNLKEKIKDDVGGLGEPFSPDIIHLDCEQSAYLAFKKNFASAEIVFCYFHLVKALRSNLCQMGYKNRLEHKHADYEPAIRGLSR